METPPGSVVAFWEEPLDRHAKEGGERLLDAIGWLEHRLGDRPPVDADGSGHRGK